ncbi:DUF6005 family protein [Falsirhodobacter xinxiangensis]|uniref:DUF6005 family protein n=1 Tax=Falsirhodobacter xinxiangensis TaxID=2530049 RepID=UPI0010AA7F8E|nr:DUF6005 family protein [Rhodobacter xinxiangensis]
MNSPRPLPSPEHATDTIRAILAGPMACPRMEAFGPDARLGIDLGLDSVSLMTLMLNLEDAGLPMPESAFDQAPNMTVAAMANLLAGIAPVAEEPIDIKVHCVVSSFCQAVKDKGIDHRALYIGLWDGQVVVDDRHRLSYHSAGIDHGFYVQWADRLFGLKVARWYDDAADKQTNLATLDRLIADWQPGRYIMPMVDLFLLPQRENKFAQDPFPHYALVQPTDDPAQWLMRDPDFRWEGTLPAADIRSAFLRDSVAGGFVFDGAALHAPTREAITAIYHATLGDDLPLIEAVETILTAHETAPEHLETALRELPVIAIRKYAYEHALAIFGDIEGEDWDAFEECCDRIAALHGGFGTVQRHAAAFSRKGDAAELAAARTELDRLRGLERGIKQTLKQWFDRWSTQ